MNRKYEIRACVDSNLIALSRAEHAKIHKTLSKSLNGEEAINFGIQTSTVYWCKE